MMQHWTHIFAFPANPPAWWKVMHYVLAVGITLLIVVLGYPIIGHLFGSRLGERKVKLVDPYKIPDMTGKGVGMDFLIADLTHIAENSKPEAGDALIILDISGMGMTVARDRRGNVRSGYATPQETTPGEPAKNSRAFDNFDVFINGEGEWQFKRYQFRPCNPNLAKRTWIIAL